MNDQSSNVYFISENLHFQVNLSSRMGYFYCLRRLRVDKTAKSRCHGAFHSRFPSVYIAADSDENALLGR